MINIGELFIVNYCHPNCKPLQNIMRLPKDKAFALAKKMAAKNPETTAFYRFADFENYYPRRIKADKILYDSFISLGGKPKEKHPLSFVLQGSQYLNKWFDCGTITKIPLESIPSEFISFTYGDSGAALDKNGIISVFTKQMLISFIEKFSGTIDQYLSEIEEKYHYIEVQIWNDEIIENLR